MSGLEKHAITSTESKNLLKEIHDKLPQQPEDSRGNRMYGPSEGLKSKVEDLLASLKLDVRGDTSIKIRQPLKTVASRIHCVANLEQHHHQKTNRAWLFNSHLYIRKPTPQTRMSATAGWYTSYTIETYLTPELDCIFVGRKK
jgi:hypothetical protein